MIRNKLIGYAGSALVAGVASLALAAPASAMQATDPGDGGLVVDRTPTTGPTEDTPWLEIGLGALGGLAIAGAGVAAANGLKHRNAVPTG